MKQLSSIIVGSTESKAIPSDFFEEIKNVVENKASTILDNRGTVSAGQGNLMLSMSVNTNVAEHLENSYVEIVLSFISPDIKKTNDFYRLDSKTIIAQKFKRIIPQSAFSSLEALKDFFVSFINDSLIEVIPTIKNSIVDSLRQQAISSLISKSKTLEESSEEISQMNLEELLSRDGVLRETDIANFPSISYQIESRINGDTEIGPRVENEAPKKQEEASSPVTIEDAPSSSQNKLEEQAIKAEKGEEQKKESPIPGPQEAKTVVENNEKEKSTQSSVFKESTSTMIQEKPKEPVNKDFKDYTDEELRQAGVKEDEIFTLRFFSLVEKEKQAIEKEEKAKRSKANVEKAAQVSSQSPNNTISSSTTSSSSEKDYNQNVSRVIKETNSQLLGQSLIQTVILANVNDSITGLKETMESYLKVSDRDTEVKQGILESIKESTLSEKTEQSEKISIGNEVKDVVTQMVALVPNEIKHATEQIIPTIDVKAKTTPYSSIENKVSNTEANLVSKSDMTKLGETLDNSIKTAVTNSTTVNNTTIERSKETPAITPPPAPVPSSTAVIQDNRASQSSLGSGMPTTINLSSATIDNIAHAIVKAMTLTPFLNYGK